jgi:hypothetical protein
MSQPAWWSPVDDAELAVLVRELVDRAWGHRCESVPCPDVRAAVEIVVDWRARRMLRSRARWLAEQDFVHLDALLGQVTGQVT